MSTRSSRHGLNVACVIVLVLGIATIMAVTIEQRGCAMLQRIS